MVALYTGISGRFAILHKNLTMKRIGYLLMFLLFSAGSQAQLIVTNTDTVVCEIDTVWFTATGYDSITWSGTATLDTNLGEANYATGSEGVYTVRIIGWDTGGVAAPMDTVNYTVEFTSGNLFSVTSSAFIESFECGQDTLTVSACMANNYTFSVSGVDSVWYTSTSLTIDHDSLGNATVTPTPGTAFISIDGLDTTSGDRDTLVIEITIISLPSLVINSTAEIDNNFVCIGNSATLTVVTDTATLDFITWMADASLDTLMGSEVVATPDSNKIYTATVTNDFGCEASATRTVFVGTIDPKFDVDVSPDFICPGDSTELDADQILGNITRYEWGPAALLGSTEGETVMAGPTVTTVFTVTATARGCKSDSSFTVNVLDAPDMSVSQSATGNLKLDETTTITVTCPSCLSYVWELPGATLTTTSNVQNVSPNTPGPNVITITGSDSSSCRNQVSITVTVDSAFAGDPWPPASVNELENEEVQVFVSNNGLEVRVGSMIQDVSMFNILGTQVLSTNPQKNEVTMPTESLTAGVYIIRVRFLTNEYTEKVYIR